MGREEGCESCELRDGGGGEEEVEDVVVEGCEGVWVAELCGVLAEMLLLSSVSPTTAFLNTSIHLQMEWNSMMTSLQRT